MKRTSWNAGFTKLTHPSVLKISTTMRRKGVDNFRVWRERMRRQGKIPSGYPSFRPSGDFAELIGVVLGDGHIEKFPRTESLTISGNTSNTGFIGRYGRIVQKIFRKEPYVARSAEHKNCTRIRIYQKDISKRLGVPVGNRSRSIIKIPAWIRQRRSFLIRYLRGLYEAEGSFCVHRPTYTFKFLFSNRNPSLLNAVVEGLEILGFHPHRSRDKIQLSRKNEVYRCKKLLQFRNY